MMRHTLGFTAAAALAMCLAWPAPANAQQRTQVSGEVVRSKQADVRGAREPYTIVLMQTDRGQLAVDLGPTSEARRARIDAGDQIDARGQLVRIGDRPLLIAEQLRIDGRQLNVRRDQQQDRARQQDRRVQDRRQMADRRPQQGRISGRIVETKQADVRGAREPYFVALVETDRGQRVAVDFGPTSQARRARFERGDQITADGSIIRVGDRPLLVARQVEVNGRQFDVRRAFEQQRQDAERQDRRRPDRREVQGEIVRLNRIQVPGVEDAELFAEIETREGQRVVADLGSVRRLGRLDLREGDRVSAEGRTVRVHDRPLFVAHELRHDGRRLELDHRDLHQQVQQPRTQRITGEILRHHRVSPPGADADFILAEIETRDRQRVTASLGSAEKLRDLDLQSGDRVAVTGRPIWIRNGRLFVAHELEHQGQLVRLDHRQIEQEQRREMAYRPDRQQDQQQQRRQQERTQQRRDRDLPGGLGVVVQRDRFSEGVRVTRVHRDSPAEQAGIRPGDHIILIDQDYIDDPTEVAATIADRDPGERVRIVFSRNGQERSTTAELEPRLEALNYER